MTHSKVRRRGRLSNSLSLSLAENWNVRDACVWLLHPGLSCTRERILSLSFLFLYLLFSLFCIIRDAISITFLIEVDVEVDIASLPYDLLYIHNYSFFILYCFTFWFIWPLACLPFLIFFHHCSCVLPLIGNILAKNYFTLNYARMKFKTQSDHSYNSWFHYYNSWVV